MASRKLLSPIPRDDCHTHKLVFGAFFSSVQIAVKIHAKPRQLDIKKPPPTVTVGGLFLDDLIESSQLVAPLTATKAFITPGRFTTGTGYVNRQGSALEVSAVERFNRRFGICLRGHLDEAESFGLVREFVLDNRCG
jgi:hypothetical protein